MKARKIFIVVGWLCIAINALGYLGAIGRKEPIFKNKGIPFIIGWHFWFLLGLLFLLIAHLQKRRLMRKNEKKLIDNFLVEKEIN